MPLSGFEVKRVLCSDPIDPECLNILKAAGIEAEQKKVTADELLKILPEYDALIVRSGTQVTAEVIAAGKNLKIIGRAGTGVDNIDCEAATKAGVLVMNTPGGNTVSAAEHTMALMMSMARNVPPAHASLKDGKWARKDFMGTELQGKTLGILGLGRIGREVAVRAQAFGMVTIGYDALIPADVVKKVGIEAMPLDDVFPKADFITVHTPLLESTRGLIGKRTLPLCKDGVRVINCARGGIIDEGAVLDALKSGKCGGAAFDVFEEEPPKNPITLELIKHPKVIVTPHLGASTSEAQNKVAREIANQIVAASTGKGVMGAVNAPAGLASAFGADLAPYLSLAQLMGTLVGKMLGAGGSKGPAKLEEISVSVQGALLHESSSIVRNAALAGLLSTMCSSPMNLINAANYAEAMGVNCGAVADVAVHPSYTNLITVSYRTAEKTRQYRATVFGRTHKRLVQIDQFHTDANLLAPSILFLRNQDRPGVAASVGAIVAASNTNISYISLGKADEALTTSTTDVTLTVIGLDSPLPQDAMDKIAALDNVIYATQVHLESL